jgi:hypothetical protein
LEYNRFRPVAPLRVLSYNVEDDLHEERRRLSATLRQFCASSRDLRGKLRIVGPTSIGTLMERDMATGRLRLTEAMVDLISHIEQFQPDLVLLDPLAELHTSDENDNTGVRSVISQLRAVAVRYNVGLVLAHHVRKGAIAPGDPDGVRGGGAIVNAARFVFTVCSMSEDEANSLSILKEARKYYFRVDGAKINLSPIEEAEWFERVAYPLDNGEDVPAAVPWQPPRDSITTNDIENIKEVLSAGINGEPFTFRSGFPRSIERLYADQGIKTDEGKKNIADALRTAGFVEVTFKSKNRRPAKGIRAPDGRPAGVEWIAE